MESIASVLPFNRLSVVDSFGATDVGYERDHNEDAFQIDPELGVMIVCDGMGGHVGGEVASSLAVMAAYDSLKLSAFRKVDPDVRLSNAITSANDVIARYTTEKPKFKGMGTTIVISLFDGSKFHLAHAGDSRAYLWNGKQVFRMTQDHGNGNYIYKAVGLMMGSGPTISFIRAAKNNTILLCSDGLTKEIPGHGIGRVLSSSNGCRDACGRLIRAALDHGGTDNVTVAMMRVG